MADSDFQSAVQCENCSELQAENAAKFSIREDGSFKVLVFSLSGKLIYGYRIINVVNNEPGYSFSNKYVSSINVDQSIIEQFSSLVDSINQLNNSDEINIPTGTCSSGGCLNGDAGRALVSTYLRAHFNFDIVVHVVLNTLFDAIVDDDYTVTACFDDGICIDLLLVNPFGSFAFLPTSEISGQTNNPAAYGGGYTNVGNEPAGGRIVCVNRIDFHQAGFSSYSWCEQYSYIP